MAEFDGSSTDRLARLEAELEALAERRDEAEADRYNSWHIRVGPLRLTGYVGSQRLGWLFIAFHVIVGSLGVLCFFLPGRLPDLGAALVVGALFGFGAFLAQVWTRQTEREEARAEDGYREALREVEATRQSVERELLSEARRLEREASRDGE
jgi:hypothetical protein